MEFYLHACVVHDEMLDLQAEAMRYGFSVTDVSYYAVLDAHVSVLAFVGIYSYVLRFFLDI